MVRALLPTILSDFETAIGRRFSFDASALKAGFTTLCNLFEPRGRSLSSVDFGGHNVLMIPSSRSHFRALLSRYRACKQLRPDTSVGILLPTHVA